MKKYTQNVNKDKLINDLPKVKVALNTWGNRHTNYQSCNIGQIVPIFYDNVMAGEKKSIKVAMTSHIVTPIAPIFNAVYTEIRAFVVPLRLCADLLNGYKTRKSPWVKVFGEDNASQNSDIVVPLVDQKLPDFDVNSNFFGDLANILGAQYQKATDNVFDSLDISLPPGVSGFATYLKDFNFLNLAAYELIYQRHYRNENLEGATSSPLYRLLFDAYNPSKASVSFPSTYTFEIANREKDYFTGMKPFTQKGDAPTVGLVGNAPVVSDTSNHDMGGSIKFGSTLGNNALDSISGDIGTTGGVAGWTSTTSSQNMHNINRSNLVADLSSAAGISIEELRLLIKTQELLEKDAMYGSRYAESLNAHFGTCPLDLTLQDPQELYKTTITSQMQAVFQTSSTNGEDSILGTIGANSTTQTEPFIILPEYEFKEDAIVMICAVHKLQNVYNSRYFKPKFNFKKARFEFFTPELNDLGFQDVTDKEARPLPAIAGFNEAFAEYRYKFNKVHGTLQNSEFAYWAPSIGGEYASLLTLYKEDPAILDKALSVNHSTAPQFYDAWGFDEVCTKPMSLHSIPGMDGVI